MVELSRSFGCAELSEERYQELLEAEKTLKKLEAAGVDNWEGYGDAFGYDDE